MARFQSGNRDPWLMGQNPEVTDVSQLSGYGLRRQRQMMPHIRKKLMEGLLGAPAKAVEFTPDTFPGEDPNNLSGSGYSLGSEGAAMSPKAEAAFKSGLLGPGQDTSRMASIQEGSGLLGGKMSQQEFYSKMATIPGYENAALKGLIGDPSTSGYTNVTQDGNGAWWGYNKLSRKVEKMPMTDPNFIKYNTVQSTDASGNPRTELVSPGLLNRGQNPQARITVGDKVKQFGSHELEAAGFANRMVSQGKRIAEFEKKGSPSINLADSITSDIPKVGNFLVDKKYQGYMQMANDWIRSKLRKESGAVIGADEWKQEFITYFPVPGDSQETVQQKQFSRKLAEQNMVGSSQGAFQKQHPVTYQLFKRQSQQIEPQQRQATPEPTIDDLIKLYGN